VLEEWEKNKRERSENMRERTRISRNGRTGVIEDSDEEGGR